MRVITNERYHRVIAASGLKAKFVRELRPKLDLVTTWEDRDFATITDRSGNKGILWIELGEQVYIVPYSLKRGIIDKLSGRARPVICDLCYTQQPGTAAARITIELPEVSRSLLCCADLDCSAHVRGKTSASVRSKAQLRETISPAEKVARLQKRLREFVESLKLEYGTI